MIFYGTGPEKMAVNVYCNQNASIRSNFHSSATIIPSLFSVTFLLSTKVGMLSDKQVESSSVKIIITRRKKKQLCVYLFFWTDYRLAIILLYLLMYIFPIKVSCMILKMTKPKLP